MPKKCVQLPSFAVHKALCAKYSQDRKEYELTEAFGRYRDENQKIYKKKCEQFRAEIKEYHDANLRVLYHHKSNSVRTPECACRPDLNCGVENSESEVEDRPSEGRLYRCRSVRAYDELPPEANVNCCLEPWFRRYLILNKFIEVARGIIIKNRMLKRLETMAKNINADPSILDDYEFPVEYMTYGELTEKYVKMYRDMKEKETAEAKLKEKEKEDAKEKDENVK